MFEHSLIGLAERKQSRRGWFTLPMAILLHLVALATFTFASVWDVAEVPEPSENIIYSEMAAPPPPPPPQRGSGKPPTEKAVKSTEVKPPTPQQVVQPPSVPTELTPVSSQVLSDIVSDLRDGGDPDGVDEGGADGGDPLTGVPYSTGTVPVPYSGAGRVEPQPVDNEPIVVGGAVKKPEILVKTQPRYTEVARRAGVEGVVVLKAVIDERGHVTDLQVIKDLPMGLDKAAMDAVRTWRFKPATLHDRPVKMYYNLTVNFQIQR